MIYISIRVKRNDPGEIYNRYKAEIKESMIFDALKSELGMKGWRKLLKNKIMLLPMDLTKDNLGLNPGQIEELKTNLNIIINAAGNLEFSTRLDHAVDINVRGPLKLMMLAEQCANFETFC